MLSWLDVEELLRIPLLEMHAWLEMPSDNVYVERPEQHLNERERGNKDGYDKRLRIRQLPLSVAIGTQHEWLKL